MVAWLVDCLCVCLHRPCQLRCRHAHLFSCRTLPSETGDCGNRTRDREMRSIRIWPLGGGGRRPASQLDGVTELLGGGLAGQMLLLAWLFGMPLCAHACVLACFVGLKHGWLPPSSRTPCLCCVGFTSFPTIPDKLRERGEYEVERGRERERESELALLAFGRLAGRLSVGRSARCFSGWLTVCSTGRAPGCWQGPWPGRAPS